MFCVECGKEIPNGVKFCPECGASQIVKVEEKPARAKPNKKISTKKETTDYSKMVKADLKKILKSKKLPLSGSKQELIERLTDKNWKKKKISARFICALTIYGPGISKAHSIGKVEGRISDKKIGKNGFGYDPIFIPLNKKITFGQMKFKTKFKIDHRAKAFKKIKKFL